MKLPKIGKRYQVISNHRYYSNRIGILERINNSNAVLSSTNIDDDTLIYFVVKLNEIIPLKNFETVRVKLANQESNTYAHNVWIVLFNIYQTNQGDLNNIKFLLRDLEKIKDYLKSRDTFYWTMIKGTHFSAISNNPINFNESVFKKDVIVAKIHKTPKQNFVNISSEE